MDCFTSSQKDWIWAFNYSINRESTPWYTHMLVFPYKREQGEHTLKIIKRDINKVLPKDKNWGTRQGTKFNTKYKFKKEDRHNSVKCLMENYPKFYNGKTFRRPIEQLSEHSGKDINFHISKYLIETNHLIVTLHNFTVLSSSFEHLS